MSMSCIDNNSIGTGIHQSLHTVECIHRHTDTGSHTQSSFGIFTSHWFIFCLCNILISNQAYQFTIFVHYRQLLNLMFLQNL